MQKKALNFFLHLIYYGTYDGERKGAEVLYYVYVLACGDGSLYTGMTNDLRRRMTLHAAVRGETLAHLLEEGSNG